MGTTGPLSDSLSRRSYDVAGPVSDGSALRTIHATFVQAALDRARRLGVSFSLPIRPRGGPPEPGTLRAVPGLPTRLSGASMMNSGPPLPVRGLIRTWSAPWQRWNRGAMQTPSRTPEPRA